MRVQEKWWWHSKKVAESLERLEQAGLLRYTQGRTDGIPGKWPFMVILKDGRFITKRQELHRFARSVRGIVKK